MINTAIVDELKEVYNESTKDMAGDRAGLFIIAYAIIRAAQIVSAEKIKLNMGEMR